MGMAKFGTCPQCRGRFRVTQNRGAGPFFPVPHKNGDAWCVAHTNPDLVASDVQEEETREVVRVLKANGGKFPS